eukprot:15477-Heterococcus_DN1.PRE.1
MGLRSITSAVYCGVVHAAGTSIATAAADASGESLVGKSQCGQRSYMIAYYKKCTAISLLLQRNNRRRHNHEHLVTTTWHAAATTCML